MAVVGFIAFGLFNFTGDPVVFMVGQDATEAEKAQLRADLGLDQPFPVQFARFVDNAAHGDFGISLRQGRPVSALLNVVSRDRVGIPTRHPGTNVLRCVFVRNPDDVVDLTLFGLRVADHELVTLYHGADVSSAEAEQLADGVRAAFPGQAIEVHSGGQPYYQYILSAE